MPLIRIQGLTVTVQDGEREKVLVDKIDLDIHEQRVLALVGGSGSGKTTTGLSILRLLHPALTIKNGIIFYGDNDLVRIPEYQMRKIRGKDIGMVFQEPLNAFNPVFTIGDQIEEGLHYHTDLNGKQRQERVHELLDLVGMPDPKQTAGSYPHQLSGGMRQRAMIAQAIACNPKLIIADEPTSNLDVTLQARIMELFMKLKSQLKIAIMIITHDLGVVAHLADEVAVMTEGRIVEFGSTDEVLKNPAHEYTKRLMHALEV